MGKWRHGDCCSRCWEWVHGVMMTSSCWEWVHGVMMTVIVPNLNGYMTFFYGDDIHTLQRSFVCVLMIDEDV